MSGLGPLNPVRYAGTPVPAPSSSGLGRRPLTAVAWVRIPSGFHIASAPANPDLGFCVSWARCSQSRRVSASAAAKRSAAHRAPGRRPSGRSARTPTPPRSPRRGRHHRAETLATPGSRSAALCAQPRLRTSASARSVNFAAGSTACCVPHRRRPAAPWPRTRPSSVAACRPAPYREVRQAVPARRRRSAKCPSRRYSCTLSPVISRSRGNTTAPAPAADR